MRQLIKIAKWTLGLFFLFLCGLYFNAVRCHHTIIAQAIGPGDSDAYAEEEMCYNESVSIWVKNKGTGYKEQIFSYYPGELTVILKWIDARHLDITIPIMNDYDLEVTRLADLDITYHFDKIEYQELQLKNKNKD